MLREVQKNMKKYVALFLVMAVAIMALAGCGKASDSGSSSDGGGTLEEYTQIPEDGIITEEQMSSIAGKDGTWYFTGSTEDGIEYNWAYDGTMVQNPADQNLKLELTEDGTDEVKKAAKDAPYCLAVTIADMYLAAAPTLTITLPSVWEADRVVYCIYEDEQLYELSDSSIEVDEDAKTTTLTLTINKAGGTFYVLGGGSVASADDAEEEESDSDSKDSSSKDDSSSSDTSKDDASDESGDSSSSSDSDKSDSKTSSEDDSNTCTITIRCDTILENIDKLDSSKKEFVPSSGVILAKTTVEFEDGDTVFDILKAVCKEKGIQMSSQYTPGHGSYYVEGINQLYEFDCGENSGWIYSVNGWTPNYGASEYSVENGDSIKWEYTCNLGSDL